MANTGRFKIDPDTGELAAADEVDAKLAARRYEKMSDLPRPAVIHDNIELQSQADGLWYSSKSALRRSYKDRGITEVGNEVSTKKKTHVPPKKSKAERRREVKDAVGRATSQLGFDTC